MEEGREVHKLDSQIQDFTDMGKRVKILAPLKTLIQISKIHIGATRKKVTEISQQKGCQSVRNKHFSLDFGPDSLLIPGTEDPTDTNGKWQSNEHPFYES